MCSMAILQMLVLALFFRVISRRTNHLQMTRSADYIWLGRNIMRYDLSMNKIATPKRSLSAEVYL